MPENTDGAPIIVTYTYQLPEHKDELRMLQMSREMYIALWDIQNKCRSVLKHGSDITRDDFAEEIQDMCWQVDLDSVN